jgi:phage tail protein X
MRIYTSVQGDWWDLISLKVYGMQRGDDHHLDILMEANYPIKDLNEFPAGVQVVVPDLPVKTIIPLVPWTSAYVVTT